LRETTDTIENLGIERAYQAIEKANIVLWIIDTSQINNQEKWLSEEIMKRVEHTPLILVFNKVDKLSEGERLALEQQFKDNRVPRILISAKERLHTDELQELLYNAAKLPELSDQDIMVTNMRHYEALKQAHTAIVRVQDGLNDRISGDFLSQDIRECLHYLGEITGQITTDEVLGNIFSKFCIGK
jgi:tRNA modification GTPase